MNPRLVLVRVSGLARLAPMQSAAGFGTLAEAMSGFAAMTGEADGRRLTAVRSGRRRGQPPGAFVTMLALYRRGTDGDGQVIDLSIYEPLLTVLGAQATIYDQLARSRSHRQPVHQQRPTQYVPHQRPEVGGRLDEFPSIAQRVDVWLGSQK